MKLETIIFSKLTQEHKTNHCMFSLISGNNENTWSQEGKHHKAGSVRSWVSREGIALGEISNVDDRLVGAVNHHGTCIPM